MKKMMLVIVFLIFSFNAYCADPTTMINTKVSSPVGLWKTIDDVTGQPKSIIQISETAEHTLEGKVVKLFNDQDKLCVTCSGEYHNKPILGLVVMSDLQQSPERKSEWRNGMILDPKNGKRYHCTITTMDNGQKLKVRGYIGLPLFGRSQTWIRE